MHCHRNFRTNNIVAAKAIAHKLARACDPILMEVMPFERNALLHLKDDNDPASHVR